MEIPFLKNDIYVKYSLLFHVLVIGMFSIGISFHVADKIPSPPPIIVDLRNVEIAPKTNLPPVPNDEIQEKPVFAKAKPIEVEKAEEPKVEPKKPEPVKNEKAAVPAVVEKTKPVIKKEEPKKPVTQPAKKKETDDLTSLLASVEKMKKNDVPARSKVQNLADTVADKGIKGGIGGDYKLALTISEQDAIASKLRACWNLDAGAKGVLDMTVELRAYLNPAGNVTDVKILDSARYNMDSSFRAIADSARRAVYVCDKRGDESPFRILVTKYPAQYEKWQELYLKFNPLDGGVF